jgi:hypothetical protein
VSSLLYAAHAGQHSNIDASANLEHGVVHLQADAACGWVHHHELPRVTGAPHRVRHIAPSNSVKRTCQVHCTHAHTYTKADATPDELVWYRQNTNVLLLLILTVLAPQRTLPVCALYCRMQAWYFSNSRMSRSRLRPCVAGGICSVQCAQRLASQCEHRVLSHHGTPVV